MVEGVEGMLRGGSIFRRHSWSWVYQSLQTDVWDDAVDIAVGHAPLCNVQLWREFIKI